jgi:hypothetical protein
MFYQLRNRLKNQGNRNNVLIYVVFYALSDDTSYFSNERTWKFTIKSKKNVLAEAHKKKLGRTTSRIVMLDIQPTIWEQNGFAPLEGK